VTRGALLLLLAPIPPVASQPPAVPLTGEYLVTGVSHGVKLTLIVPRKAYPRDALVQVTIILKNLSHSQMWIEVHSSPPVSAVLHPATSQQRGDLYHAGWYACRMANGQIQFGGSGFYEGPPGPQGIPPFLFGYLYFWAPSQSRVLQPGCSSPLEWHVVAGWLNQPVARVDYVTVPGRG